MNFLFRRLLAEFLGFAPGQFTYFLTVKGASYEYFPAGYLFTAPVAGIRVRTRVLELPAKQMVGAAFGDLLLRPASPISTLKALKSQLICPTWSVILLF